MPTTSRYGWSTPAPTDPDDVPTDMASLASQIEATMSTILARLPYRVLTGMVSIVPSAANTPTYVDVTFPAGRFSAAPVVQVTPSTGAPGTLVTGVGVVNVTTTGCRIYLTRTNTGSTGVYWTAIQV